MLISFTACEKDLSDNKNEVKLAFYNGAIEVADLNKTIHLNGVGTVNYVLNAENTDGMRITARVLGAENVKVSVNSSSNSEGSIIISSVAKEEIVLEVTLMSNGKVVQVYQLKITNFKDEEEKEEKDESYVSLNTLVDAEGMCNIYVYYRPNGSTSSYELPIMVKSLHENKQNLDVNIAVDSDTLTELNKTRYLGAKYLYYKQLPENCYSFASTCHIPSGTETQKLTIDFKNINNLDVVEKWVLPLTIEESSSYKINTQNGKHKAFLRIMPFNDYSGEYNGELEVSFEASDSFIMTSLKTLVVDEKTILFYAGMGWDQDFAYRNNYKVFIRFTDEKIDAQKNKVEIWSDNAENNNFKIGEEPSYYTWKEEVDTTNPNLKHIDITLYLSYTYEDYTTSPNIRDKYAVKGTVSMQRDLDTSRIPNQN